MVWPGAGRGALWTSVRAWSGKGVLALLDQGLISGSNFLVTVVLARQILPHAYGAYALAFELYLLLIVAYGALVLEPMSVFGSSVYRESLREYTGVLLRIHAVIGATIFILVGISAWIIRIIAPGRGLAGAFLGVAIAVPCVLFFWVARRAFYVQLEPRQAVARGAVVYAAIVIGGLALCYWAKVLSPLLAFLLMAAGALATTPAMLSRLKPIFRKTATGPSAREVIGRHWGYGRWAVLSALATWLAGAIYYPLLGGFRGLADTGSLKALMNFASPIGQIFTALSLLALPYTARAHHSGGAQATRRVLWKLMALYTGGTILYWAVITGLRGPIITHLYAGKYLAVAGLVPWLALSSILRISSTAQAVTLRAMNRPNLVFVAYSASCIAAVVAGIPCTWAFGLSGAIMALILSNAATLAVAVIIVHRKSPLARTG